jgi:TatD DNase family protein
VNSQQSTINHQLVETHAHLDYPDFANDFDDVLRRATEAGVTRIITIGTSVESSRRAVDLAEKYPNIFAVIGVHPTYAEEAGEDVITPLRELAKSPRVVAIGETGLDYHRLPSIELAKDRKTQVFAKALQTSTDDQIEAQIHDGAYKSKQASLFQQQLDLAVELRLNVVVHQRDAWNDTLEILRDYGRQVSGVFHCFGGTLEQANEVLAMGHLVSFTGIVTFKNGAAVREVAAQIPLDQFMVETDCPYLAPVPFRGKRCEPAHTRLVAESIANARGITLEEIARATTVTAEEFFRFDRAQTST